MFNYEEIWFAMETGFVLDKLNLLHFLVCFFEDF